VETHSALSASRQTTESTWPRNWEHCRWGKEGDDDDGGGGDGTGGDNDDDGDDDDDDNQCHLRVSPCLPLRRAVSAAWRWR
jgi:hypothetical protein